MEQWKAAGDTTLYFELELGEHDDSLDATADDDLLELETNNKGQPFLIKIRVWFDPI